jgi:hypothetical protein
MKIRNFTLFSAALVFGAIMFSQTKVTSNPNTPPTARTGAPPSGNTCGTCHSGEASAPNAAKFTLKLGITQSGLADVVNNTTTYVPGTSYFMSLGLNGTANKYGFELVALDSTNAMAGSFTATNTTQTQVVTASGKQYFCHKNAQGAASTFIYKWTAPAVAVGTGKVTFYYAGDFSDGNGSENSGEDIEYSSSTVVLASEGPNGIENISSKLSAITAYPTVFSQNIQLSFDVKENTKVEATLISLSGQAGQTLMNEEVSTGSFNRSFNADNLAAGVYLLKLQAGNSSVVKKIIKL